MDVITCTLLPTLVQFSANWWPLAALLLTAIIGACIAGEDSWETLSETAARLKVHEATLRREIKRGRLRAATIGGRRAYRLRASWADSWLEATAAEPIEVRK